jgi:hypothetical protein
LVHSKRRAFWSLFFIEDYFSDTSCLPTTPTFSTPRPFSVCNLLPPLKIAENSLSGWSSLGSHTVQCCPFTVWFLRNSVLGYDSFMQKPSYDCLQSEQREMNRSVASNIFLTLMMEDVRSSENIGVNLHYYTLSKCKRFVSKIHWHENMKNIKVLFHNKYSAFISCRSFCYAYSPRNVWFIIDVSVLSRQLRGQFSK